MRKLLTVAAGAAVLLALSGCTGNSNPSPSVSSGCLPEAPSVPASVKAGGSLAVKGAPAECNVKFTSKDHLVYITLTGAKGELLASSSTKAKADGSYTVKLTVPSLASGEATVSIDSGFKRTGTVPTAAPIRSKITIAKLVPGT